MKTLYVIGTGFDSNHGLSTQWEDFHMYIQKNENELVKDLKKYFSIEVDNEILWSNFEEYLATFDWKTFFDDNYFVYPDDDNFRISDTYGLEDDLDEEANRLIESIREAFESWIGNIDIEFVEEKMPMEKDSFFINFNYTLLLENVYQIQKDKILHIHGDIEKNKIVFGHNMLKEEEPELDKNGDSNRTPFSDSESASKYPFYAFYKPVENIIEENKTIFEQLGNVKKIIVLGHSLNEIDLPYFKEILKHTSNAKWEVSYYKENEEEHHFNTLQNIGVCEEDIMMFKL